MRPFVLTIAGHDPSGGAGLNADVKTFEQHKVLGLSVCTAVTVQNTQTFASVNWVDENLVIDQLSCLLDAYQPKCAKIGLVSSVDELVRCAMLIKQSNKECKLVWDPILKSTTGFEFHNGELNLSEVLRNIDIVTPNMVEAEQLFGGADPEMLNAICQKHPQMHIILKGGHSENKKGYDYLINSTEIRELKGDDFGGADKHGTGCILSAAIASNLAHGKSNYYACKKAKAYVEKVILSNDSLLGYHFR